MDKSSIRIPGKMEKFDQNPWEVRSESPEIDPLYRGSSIKTHRGFYRGRAEKEPRPLAAGRSPSLEPKTGRKTHGKGRK
ncbi:MAG: hypothetical protein ACYDBP_10100 [Leptospirales bacterium]